MNRLLLVCYMVVVGCTTTQAREIEQEEISDPSKGKCAEECAVTSDCDAGCSVCEHPWLQKGFCISGVFLTDERKQELQEMEAQPEYDGINVSNISTVVDPDTVSCIYFCQTNLDCELQCGPTYTCDAGDGKPTNMHRCNINSRPKVEPEPEPDTVCSQTCQSYLDCYFGCGGGFAWECQKTPGRPSGSCISLRAPV